MSTKDWKNRELHGLLMERFGFKFNSLDEEEEIEESYDGEEELEEAYGDEEEIEEGSGDRNDDREQSRSPGHSQRNSSGGGPGISEAQIRTVAKRVVRRLKRAKKN